jgi:hypothetical protein
MYKLHTACRACRSTALTPVFDLGVQPLSNAHVKPGDEQPGWAPLRVLACEDCTLAQLSVVVDPAILYSHYTYTTSQSKTMARHFERICGDLLFQSGLKTPTLLEIGSNDGTFLRYAQTQGFSHVIGIDPAKNLHTDVQTLAGLFDEMTASVAKEQLGQVDVILARHVFCHVDNWREFIKNLVGLCHEKTVIAIEVPYCLDMLNTGEFDAIYHEHTSYMTKAAMAAALEGSGLRIDQILDYDIHGGSICFIIRPGIQTKMKRDVTLSQWEIFNNMAKGRIYSVQEKVHELVRDNKVVAGFGAPAKATVMINACKFTSREIQFVTDTTPGKIGTMIPGTDIPIVDEKELYERNPDYAVMFAWNYQKEIISKHHKYRGKFVIPFPTLKTT